MVKLWKTLIDAHFGNEAETYNIIVKFRPLIGKYARQLSYDCAETDLIIAILEFIRDLEPCRVKGCEDAVLVVYIARMLHNKKIDIYRNQIKKKKLEETNAYFGDIRTLIPETSGQHVGIIRTAYRKHPDTLPG